jgi:SAM-dependent methyltransferase
MSDMWNSVAPVWERHAAFVDAHLAGPTEAMLDAAGVGPGAAVLEVAAGPGGAGLAAAARVGAGGRVVLTDVAPDMVAAAERRAADLPHVSAQVADELALGLEAGTFDAVICRHGLMFAEPPADAVREAASTLRPGGRYATLVWAARPENPWLGLLFDAIGEQFGVQFPPPHIAGPFALDDPGRLEAALADGGLTDVSVQQVPAPMRLGSVEEWWAQVPQLAGPVAQALAGMEPDVRDAIRDRALAKGAAAARETDGGIELDGAVLLGSGTRA